jgi:hypothetical protein
MSGLREAFRYLTARPLDPLVEGLLLETARPESGRPLGRLTAGPDTWTTVLRLAEAHNTLAGCAFRLGDAEGVPEAARERLSRVREEVVSLDRLQVAVLADLLNAFAARGIPVMVLKGARIAELLHARPAARIGKDIDLLVQPQDRDAAGELIAERGFTCRDRAYYETHHFHHTWIHRSRKLAERVELHWDVTLPASSVRFPIEAWWQAARVVSLRAGETLAPPPADEFAYIAYHATCRGMPRLRDLGDVAALWGQATRNERDAMLESAGAARALGYVATACGLAHAYWGLEDYALELRTASPSLVRHIYAPHRILGQPDPTWWAIEELGAWSLQLPGKARTDQLLQIAARDRERSPWARRKTPPARWKVAGSMLGAAGVVRLAAALRRF